MSLEVFSQRILPMKDQLFRLAFRLLQNAEEAEDVIQDVMVKIWVKRAEWAQWQSMEGYCMVAVRNSCLERLRSKKRFWVKEDAAADVQDINKGPSKQMEDKELYRLVREIMEALPEKQHLVMHLREMEGRSYQEIAEILDLSMEQVKVYLFRARNTIKNAMIKEDVSWSQH